MNFEVSHGRSLTVCDAYDALVHCIAGIRKRHQQWNEWMAASAASVRRAGSNSRLSTMIVENKVCAY